MAKSSPNSQPAKPTDALPFSLPFRQIHLDFHTGPAIPDVGSNFDPREFARIAKAAHINSITLFAKCHHGHLYYNTARPERHPGLAPGLNLLAQQVEALHAEGIRAPIYLSVQCDEYAANTHPEWVARDKSTALVKWGRDASRKALEPGWQILDLGTPYADFLADQTAEVLKFFKPVDGIFFDMCWDQPSYNPIRLEAMIKDGLNPEKDEDIKRYSNIVSRRYIKRYYDMVKAASKDATVFFNGRPFFQLSEDIPFQTQAEIEALPTGGWGYMYFPINVRYARTFNKPYMGMTARFHKSWADFGGIKPYAALEYETAQMIAHGARCSIGDQLHPRGTLDLASYKLIGKVYKRVEDREPWLENASPLSEVGLFQLPSGNLSTMSSSSRSDEGATRMLTQLRQQFDVVQPTSDLSSYKLLILPDGLRVDAPLAAKLKSFLASGGKILATGHSGLNPEATACALSELAIKPAGPSPFQSTYMRFASTLLDPHTAETDSALASYDSDHILYDRSLRVTASKDAFVAAHIVEPYFDRTWQHFCSHNQTPSDKPTKFAAAVVTSNTAYIAFPVFNSFAEHGNLPYRFLIKQLLHRLLPEPLLRVSGPSYIESTVQKQNNRHIVHLLAYSAERRTQKLDIIEDIIPLYDLKISLKLEKSPTSVYLAPSQLPLPFTYKNGRANLTLPILRGHEMLVFE